MIRPHRHQLGDELHRQWRAHLCGLCLSLRDQAGQAARVLTGYDILLLSVLTEAQGPALATRTAGPCPLRGFRAATVVRSDEPAMILAVSGGLLAGATGLSDKVADADLAAGLRPVAALAARRMQVAGQALAATVSFDPSCVLAAPAQAVEQERTAPRRSDGTALAPATLDALLAPTGSAVGSLFAHTAEVAGVPANTGALAAAGDAFGRLVHLLDAIEDRVRDATSGKFNPLAATATSAPDARRLAEELGGATSAALQRAVWRDDRLVRALFGPVLDDAVRRATGHRHACTLPPDHHTPLGSGASRAPGLSPRGPRGFKLVAMAAGVQMLGSAALCGRQGYRLPRLCRSDFCGDAECDCCHAESCEGCCEAADCCSGCSDCTG